MPFPFETFGQGGFSGSSSAASRADLFSSIESGDIDVRTGGLSDGTVLLIALGAVVGGFFIRRLL